MEGCRGEGGRAGGRAHGVDGTVRFVSSPGGRDVISTRVIDERELAERTHRCSGRWRGPETSGLMDRRRPAGRADARRTSGPELGPV